MRGAHDDRDYHPISLNWFKKKKKHQCEQWFKAKEYKEENATIKDLFRQWYQKKKITQSKKETN